MVGTSHKHLDMAFTVGTESVLACRHVAMDDLIRSSSPARPSGRAPADRPGTCALRGVAPRCRRRARFEPSSPGSHTPGRRRSRHRRPEIIAPEFRIHANRIDGQSDPLPVGQEGFVGWIEQTAAAFSGLTFTTTVGPIADDEHLAGQWHAAGTYSGGMPGIIVPEGSPIMNRMQRKSVGKPRSVCGRDPRSRPSLRAALRNAHRRRGGEGVATVPERPSGPEVVPASRERRRVEGSGLGHGFSFLVVKRGCRIVAGQPASAIRR